MRRGRNNKTRELILQNIMINYGKHGIKENMINDLIDAG